MEKGMETKDGKGDGKEDGKWGGKENGKKEMEKEYEKGDGKREHRFLRGILPYVYYSLRDDDRC